MSNRLMDNVVLSNNKTGIIVEIKVICGSYSGQQFTAKKVQENSIYCYHIEKDGIKTYFSEKDIVEIA